VGNGANGKIALIVGGSRGIGRAISLRLARSGFDLWLTYRGNHSAAEEVKQEVEGTGRSCERWKRRPKSAPPTCWYTTPVLPETTS
jgi:3-oxoacyl-[acyl-carrier protein] reductase